MLSPHIEGDTPLDEEEHHHVWGENEEEEVGLHITASVDPRELMTDDIPSTTPLMEDRHLQLPSVLELWVIMIVNDDNEIEVQENYAHNWKKPKMRLLNGMKHFGLSKSNLRIKPFKLTFLKIA